MEEHSGTYDLLRQMGNLFGARKPERQGRFFWNLYEVKRRVSRMEEALYEADRMLAAVEKASNPSLQELRAADDYRALRKLCPEE